MFTRRIGSIRVLLVAVLTTSVLTLVPPAGAHDWSTDGDPCVPEWFSWPYSSLQEAQDVLRSYNFHKTADWASGYSYGEDWTKSDFSYQGHHIVGAYRVHAIIRSDFSIRFQGIPWNPANNLAEPNPEQFWSFGGYIEGYNYVNDWHARC